MTNFKTYAVMGVSIFLLLISFQNQSFGQDVEENIFPDWIKQSVIIWVNGEISDSEFLALIQNVLDNDVLPNNTESQEISKNISQTVIKDIPELYGEKTAELIPYWVKDRAQWWIEGKINDLQFLRTIHYLSEVGYLEYDPQKNIFSNNETFQSSLEKFLLNDKEMQNITKETKWRTFSTEYEFEEKEGVVDSVKIIFNDITRVYEPIFYKFKVPTLVLQISEFNNKHDLENHWNSFENKDKQKFFDSSYLKGKPSTNSECLFNYTLEGAVTSCIYDNLILHVIIFDQHNEHYDYRVTNLILDENEPTSKFAGEILKKISFYKNQSVSSELYGILQNETQNENLDGPINETQTASKSVELEKSKIQGVENFSCIRDDFGLVTISGQYHNDNVQRNQVELEILFLDRTGNIVGKTGTTFNDLTEFESKRFVGHSKWNENFYSCLIEIK